MATGLWGLLVSCLTPTNNNQLAWFNAMYKAGGVERATTDPLAASSLSPPLHSSSSSSSSLPHSTEHWRLEFTEEEKASWAGDYHKYKKWCRPYVPGTGKDDVSAEPSRADKGRADHSPLLLCGSYARRFSPHFSLPTL